MTRAWHRLFDGNLTDMPGRSESWTESVAYLGHGRWSLCIDSTDFCGFCAEPKQFERLSTKGVIAWTFERDGEDRDSELARRPGGVIDGEEYDPQPGPGSRTLALLEAARIEGATHCVRLLTAPPRLRPLPLPEVVAIIGLKRRQLWVRAFTVAIAVETTIGPGFLTPSPDDWTTAKFSTMGGWFAKSGPIKLTPQQADVVRLLWMGREVAGA